MGLLLIHYLGVKTNWPPLCREDQARGEANKPDDELAEEELVSSADENLQNNLNLSVEETFLQRFVQATKHLE